MEKCHHLKVLRCRHISHSTSLVLQCYSLGVSEHAASISHSRASCAVCCRSVCRWRDVGVPLFAHVGWRRGIVVSGVRRMNEVNARRARLVPGWVTVFGREYHLGM